MAGGSGSGAKDGAKVGVKAGAQAGVKAGSQGWESRLGDGASELRGVFESKVAADTYAGKGAGDVGNYIFSLDFELIIHMDKGEGLET